MRLPRDISGEELASRLARLGYACTRQTGSHMRLTTKLNGTRHDQAGEILADLRAIHVHVHLENNVLVPRALAMRADANPLQFG